MDRHKLIKKSFSYNKTLYIITNYYTKRSDTNLTPNNTLIILDTYSGMRAHITYKSVASDGSLIYECTVFFKDHFIYLKVFVYINNGKPFIENHIENKASSFIDPNNDAKSFWRDTDNSWHDCFNLDDKRPEKNFINAMNLIRAFFSQKGLLKKQKLINKKHNLTHEMNKVNSKLDKMN